MYQLKLLIADFDSEKKSCTRFKITQKRKNWEERERRREGI